MNKSKLSVPIFAAISLALGGLSVIKERVVSKPVKDYIDNKTQLLAAQQKRERKNALRLKLRVQ